MNSRLKVFLVRTLFGFTLLLLGASPALAARCPRCHRYYDSSASYQCPYCYNANSYNNGYNSRRNNGYNNGYNNRRGNRYNNGYNNNYNNYNSNYNAYDYDQNNYNASSNNNDAYKKLGQAAVVQRTTCPKSKSGPLVIFGLLAAYLYRDHPILGIIVGGLVVLGFIGNCCDKKTA